MGFFWAFTYPLPPNNLKNQNFLKTNEHPADIIILHAWTKNYEPVMYGSWDIVHNGPMMDRQTNRQKKWHSRHKQTQALTISFSNMVKHSNSYIKCRVWPNGSCFVIHDEVLNFHDWIICYHELFHNKIKKDN